ncbi:MAG: hypothetical protein IJ891_04655 [Prevotella sp.]|nr:hypothetical protein [Prevotella sp.]
MAIKKSKNKESITDFDNMMNEVEEELEVQQAEQDIVNQVPELKQLSNDIDKATTAVINAKLSLESSIRQSQREEGILGAAVNTISNKVDSINEHIDQVLEDAPTKLKVTVTVCDTDWQKMQELHNQWMEQEKQMLADQYKQQEVLWQKQSHRLTDIVRNNEGVWLSQRLFYIIGSLSLLSIITIVLEIAFYVYFHWIL